MGTEETDIITESSEATAEATVVEQVSIMDSAAETGVHTGAKGINPTLATFKTDRYSSVLIRLITR